MAPRILLARHDRRGGRSPGGTPAARTFRCSTRGRRGAALLGERLHRAAWSGLPDVEVRTSPLSRAKETCELAGFGDRAREWDALVEWDYGAYEGLTPDEIKAAGPGPGWLIWRDGVPEGESIAGITARADAVVEWARSADRDVLVFAHGHILRTLGARWLGYDASFAARIRLDPTSLSILGWAYGEPAILERHGPSGLRRREHGRRGWSHRSYRSRVPGGLVAGQEVRDGRVAPVGT